MGTSRGFGQDPVPNELFELGHSSPTWGLPRPRRGVAVEEQRTPPVFEADREIPKRFSLLFRWDFQ